MKSAALALSLIALLAAKGVEATAADTQELSVKASGLNWKVNWGKAVMDGLKRLSGAMKVAQDDFSAGVGTYIVSFETIPAASVADVKKELGKYKVEEVRLKITTQAPEGHKVGDLTLAGDDCLKELKELKGKKVVLSGVLTDGDKGRLLTLSKVSEAK